MLVLKRDSNNCIVLNYGPGNFISFKELLLNETGIYIRDQHL